MSIFSQRRDRLAEAVSATVAQHVHELRRGIEAELGKFKTIAALKKEELALKERIETYKLTALRKQEERDKEVREVEHKVGLMKKQQEWETKKAKQETELEVRQELTRQQEEFLEEKMEYIEEKLGEQLTFMREHFESLLARLPDAELAVTLARETQQRED